MVWDNWSAAWGSLWSPAFVKDRLFYTPYVIIFEDHWFFWKVWLPTTGSTLFLINEYISFVTSTGGNGIYTHDCLIYCIHSNSGALDVGKTWRWCINDELKIWPQIHAFFDENSSILPILRGWASIWTWTSIWMNMVYIHKQFFLK